MSGARVRAPLVVAAEGRNSWVREQAGGREWRVAADGFWQVHPGAADTLVSAVRDANRIIVIDRGQIVGVLCIRFGHGMLAHSDLIEVQALLWV